MDKNRFGLSRHIPEDVKLKVRQNSKFACVIPNCRNSFYEYEHIDPEFKDAEEHDPDKICLVCCNHNPRRTGSLGQENYSKAQIKRFYELIRSNDLAPSAVNRDFFNGFDGNPKIIFGGTSFIGFESIICIDGIDVFSFQKNTDSGLFSPQITFSGLFKNSLGDTLFQLKNNEWASPTYHWDVKTGNGEITIWDSSKGLVFKALKHPDKNSIEVVKLDMWFDPFHILVEDEVFSVSRYSSDKKSRISFSIGASFEAGYCGIYLDSKELFNFPVEAGFSTNGGEVHVIGNGIWLGRGGTRMWIKHIAVYKTDSVLKVQIATPIQKKGPPEGAHYFVVGKLFVKKIQFPYWTEDNYYLNSQRLRNLPHSWGKINNEGDDLFYICSDEPEDLSKNIGFIGFYADDVLEQEWSDKVFEAVVEDVDEEGNLIQIRVKRSEIGARRIVEEINTESNNFFHPHAFAGCSPWKG